MRHPRVRRPFIVESRGSARDGGSVAIPKRVPPSPQLQTKAATDTARPFFDPWAAVTAPPEPAAAARRILPNLMTPPEPEQAQPEVAAPVDEPRLPRVRRVKPKAAAAPRPAAAAEPPAPLPRPAASAAIIKPEIAAAPALRIPLRGDRTGRAALPAGQRWKARLPRACW